jgi:hypothetical protein
MIEVNSFINVFRSGPLHDSFQLRIHKWGVGDALDALLSKSLHFVGFVFGVVSWEENPFGVTLASQYMAAESI